MTLSKSLEAIASRRRWTRSDARAVLTAAERSGLSLRAFAVEHGMDAQRLYRWRKELRHEIGEIGPVRFEELVVRRETAESNASRIEVVVPSGCVLRIGKEFDESTLRRVLAVLEGGSA